VSIVDVVSCNELVSNINEGNVEENKVSFVDVTFSWLVK
jgi:hypothetical protein